MIKNSKNYFHYFDEEIYLRPLSTADLDGAWIKWMNDPEVTRFTRGFYPATRFSQNEYINSLINNSEDVALAIVTTSDDRHIGNIGLHKIHPINRTANMGMLLGEKNYWGRGYATKCWSIMSGYAFNVLNLNKVCMSINSENIASIKSAEKAGFKLEGRLIQQVFKGGVYQDELKYGLLKKDWNDTNKK